MKIFTFLCAFAFSGLTAFSQCAFSASTTQTNVTCNGGSNGSINLTVTPQSTKGLLISEIFTNPAGNDSTFEFVELVATKYIDFSITPYTIICCNNGVANPQGWLSGSTLTYAFEISTGIANAGEVIYVGGSSMAPVTNVFRSINTSTTTGDGFIGNPSPNGVIGNGGIVDGVAVFNAAVGTLNGNSVPDDAIFYGTAISTAFVNTTQGYQLPVNDSYAGGVLQTTSFFAVNPGQDEYLFATGNYDVESNTFTVPRTWSTTTTFTNLSSSVSLTHFYTFTWSNSATTEDISGLTQGTYTYSVNDGTCTVNGSVTISQPTTITATFSTGNVSCNGGNDGVATITPSGGTPGYTYSWSSGGTNPTETGLAAGTYTCTVIDANNCVATPTVTITQPNPIAATFSTISPSCVGSNNGSATILPTGGTAPYTYSWAPVGGTNATASGLTAGNYTITITDVHACTATATVAVVDPPPINTFISGFTNVSCNGGNNGTASTITSGGTPGYTYVWSPNGGNGATGTGLTAGTYTCAITDSHGCAASLTVTITEPPLLTGTISSTSVSCHGGNNGSATVVAAGGTPGYFYSWSSGGTNATESGLSAGTYTVNISDQNLCSTTATVTVTEPPLLVAGINASTNVTCNGGNNGTASVNVVGGTPAYTYYWSPSGGNGATATGLTAGTYTCTINDANNCSTSVTVTLTEPTAIAITASTTNATCGFNNGTATASATGGNPGYTYSWSSGGNTSTVIGLFAGYYTITVTDASGCTNTQQVSVLNPNAPTITPFSNPVTCFGSTNGSAAVIASGGNPGYTYLWSTGATIPNLNAVGAGTYTISVTDQSSCMAFTSITITQPPQITATFTTIPEICNGGNNGSATVVASGGVPGYSYSWSSGGTTTTESGLSAGTYTVTITDANACAVQSTVAITQPTPMAVSFANMNVTCNGGNNGSATATVSGGTPAYTYSWMPSVGSSATVNSLTAGIYTLTVTDANGCSTVTNDTIIQAPSMILTTSSTGVLCSYDSTGSATVVATGGAMPYSYSWSNGDATATANGLIGGTYTVTVTDSLLCSNTTTVTVAAPSPVAITSTTTGNVCSYDLNGSATITATGGTPGYTYSWSNGGTTTMETGLASGTYTVTVTDANDCHFSSPVTITSPPPITIATTITNASCNGGTNGGASIVASGGTPAYSYLWSTGSTTTSISNVGGGFYTVTITDNNSCTYPFTINVTNPNAPVVSVVSTSESCNGGNTGAGVSTVTGGNPGYTYSWTGGGTGPNDFNLAAGNYTLTVTDQSGCQGFGMAIVTQPPPGSLHALGNDTTICLPANSYQLCAPPIYSSFLWNTGATTHCITATTSGCYNVMVADGNGCRSADTVCLTFTSCVGIQQEELSAFEIFPNPASSEINISLGNNVEQALLEIYDARGKLMEQKTIHAKETVDVSDYAKGMYFIRINGETKKIIVE